MRKAANAMKRMAAIFDLDGTLLDTLEDLCDAVNYTMRRYNSPERTLEEVRSFVGNGVAELVSRSLENGRENRDYERALADFMAFYKERADIKTRPYPKTVELLMRLCERGIVCAVVTNKPDSAAKALCQKHFGGLLEFVIGDREGLKRKPARDKIDAMMSELCIDKAVYIGDSEVDVLTAKNAEMPCVCVTWGFRDRDVLEECGGEIFVNTADELEKEILRLLGVFKEVRL